MWKAFKDGFVVGCVGEFLCEVLFGPVFVVHAAPPESAFGDVVDTALISDIDLLFVLPVVEGELVTFELFHVVFSEWEV